MGCKGLVLVRSTDHLKTLHGSCGMWARGDDPSSALLWALSEGIPCSRVCQSRVHDFDQSPYYRPWTNLRSRRPVGISQCYQRINGPFVRIYVSFPVSWRLVRAFSVFGPCHTRLAFRVRGQGFSQKCLARCKPACRCAGSTHLNSSRAVTGILAGGLRACF